MKNHKIEKLMAQTPRVEAFQHELRDACDGHEVEDCFAASLWHFLALYGYTHSEAQHQRLCEQVFVQILTDYREGCD
jgi:hypothetical protein